MGSDNPGFSNSFFLAHRLSCLARRRDEVIWGVGSPRRPLVKAPVVMMSRIAQWIMDSASPVAFTGAGISTESGIPDFRSPHGVWAKNRTIYFEEFVRDKQARWEYWRQKCESHREFAAARPNAGHRFLAKLEVLGQLHGVITQNIDGLHQIAGNRQVLELHGTAREIACLTCDYRIDADSMVEQFQRRRRVPDCPECGGLLKHATISFGQDLSTGILDTAIQWSQQTDLMLAFGSSLVVTPAADLPRIAKQRGAKLVIINRDATPLDQIADAVVNSPIGETVDQISTQLGWLRGDDGVRDSR